MSWPGQPGGRATFPRRRPASSAAGGSLPRSGRSSPRRAWSASPGRAGSARPGWRSGPRPTSVAGEHLVPVPPLELPDPDPGEPLAALRRSEAVMLFTERAAAASGSFELTSANQATVVDLCRRLDGLPLAIELAAVRTRVLSVAQVLDRLADRFSLLTGGSRGALPRHQTLRTTIEWSHDLLTEDERVVLRRCCAFAGRFTLDDVASVCSSPDGGLDLLSSLVDQ